MAANSGQTYAKHLPREMTMSGSWDLSEGAHAQAACSHVGSPFHGGSPASGLSYGADPLSLRAEKVQEDVHAVIQRRRSPKTRIC